MKRTKIVATVGPSCADYNTLKKMCLNGLNVIRLNLSHAKQPDMDLLVKNVAKLRKELKQPLPIMIDTRGPEVRVKTFKGGSVEIKKGQDFVFTGREVEGNNKIVSINLPEIVKSVKVGNKILACDGMLTFKVVDVKGKDIATKAANSGTFSNNKSLFLPNVNLNAPYLNELDKADILWAIKNDIDLIAISFVNCKEDVFAVKDFINSNGGYMKIISKIESALGVQNLNEIIDASDGVMVARGDLGVELPIERLPDIQKTIIKRAKEKGKITITATEMLESMINNSRATRAEVSDVANAVYDGSSAVMLSGETASGKFPVEAVKTMCKVCVETEKHINFYNQFKETDAKLNDVTDVVSHSAVDASFLKQCKLIVAFTTSGQTAKMVSRFRPESVIVAVTPNEKVYRQLELCWGVMPVLSKVYTSTDEMFKIANNLVKKLELAKPNDSIVITCGTPNKLGSTNLLKIETLY